MQVGCVQDGNNVAIVVATKQNWKLRVMVICKHNFWKDMFVKPMDNLILSSSFTRICTSIPPSSAICAKNLSKLSMDIWG